ncbi:MAG: hypothetical protein IV090_07350 [Candidatus Sericytochromatia bacterium]|nr:hypothetical protein [Candidatus Sericytochromatia bacterium]
MSDSETQVWEDEEMNTHTDPSLDEALDGMFPTDEPIEIMADASADVASLDAELDNMFPTDEEPTEFVAEATEEAAAEEAAEMDYSDSEVASADEPAGEVAYADEPELVEETELVEEELDVYPAFDESEEEAVAEAVVVAEESYSEPESSSVSQGADDFNLATLNQLVDEIRQESQRVSDMKASVAKALSLIQEMSESLKS